MQTSQEQYIEFGIENENYGLKISDIQEIIRYQELTEIPNSKAYVRGVINLRGRIIPVISIRKLLSLEDDNIMKSTRIIVVNHKQESIGIIVDRVNKVSTYTDIQPPPEQLGGVSGVYFTGIGISEDKLTGILKLDEVLIQN